MEEGEGNAYRLGRRWLGAGDACCAYFGRSVRLRSDLGEVLVFC